jgi:hypothetical protein
MRAGLSISEAVVVCPEPFVITVVDAMSMEQFALDLRSKRLAAVGDPYIKVKRNERNPGRDSEIGREHA